jgi:hypothetical protein
MAEVAWNMIEGAVENAKGQLRAAMEVVADELLHELKVEVSTFCPVYATGKGKHSPPFAYPYEESGEFRGNLYTTVTDSGSGVSLRLYSKTKNNHGKYLNEGWTARNGTKVAARPYGELILVKKNWVARIAEVARALNG